MKNQVLILITPTGYAVDREFAGVRTRIAHVKTKREANKVAAAERARA